MTMLILFLQVLYTLTNWRWVKTALGIFFVIWLAEIALATGILISILPTIMNMLSELIKMI